MTFLNPLLLLAAAGISLPLLAHLLNRHQVKQTDWAAMQFLNRNVRIRSRKLRLRDILLLVLRCLAVLCLVLALARPATISDGWFALFGEPRAGVVIALDASFSMGHSDGQTTRFERAIRHVEAISETIHTGDPVTLVLLGGENRVVARNLAYDTERFALILKDLEVSAEPLNLSGVPKQLEALAQDMDAPQKEIYIISDIQTTDWGEVSTQLQESLGHLNEQASVFFVPISGGVANLAVTGLDLVSGTLRKGSVARYRATVHNFGDSPVSDIEVRCKVGGAQIDSKRIPVIAPGVSETVSLFIPFYNAGPMKITAEIDDEALSIDNERRAVAVVRERVSVLIVDGSSGDAGQLITAALLARAGGSDDENFVVRTLQWPAVPSSQIDQADVVIMADVPEITPEQSSQLANFVRQGNGLVWFAGEQVKARAWNELSSDGADAILPAVLGSATNAGDSLGVGKPLSADIPDHTVCRPLQSLPEDLFSETRFLRYMHVEPRETSFVVLGLAGSNTPVLLEQALGRGNVFMFTTTAQTAWNNMAQTPVFPMLLQQIVTYLASREFEHPRLVGDSLSLSYIEQPDASDAVFDSPTEHSITVPVREYRDQYVALLDKSREAGFYVARVSVQAPGMPIAVNVDTRESEVACLTAAELAERLDQTGITITTDESELSASIAQARTGRSSWRVFMIAGLVFLVLESLLADRKLTNGSAGDGATAKAQGEG